MTTIWFTLVIVFGGVILTLGLGFLGAALARNNGRMEQAEATRAMLMDVRPDHS